MADRSNQNWTEARAGQEKQVLGGLTTSGLTLKGLCVVRSSLRPWFSTGGSLAPIQRMFANPGDVVYHHDVEGVGVTSIEAGNAQAIPS